MEVEPGIRKGIRLVFLELQVVLQVERWKLGLRLGVTVYSYGKVRIKGPPIVRRLL